MIESFGVNRLWQKVLETDRDIWHFAVGTDADGELVGVWMPRPFGKALVVCHDPRQVVSEFERRHQVDCVQAPEGGRRETSRCLEHLTPDREDRHRVEHLTCLNRAVGSAPPDGSVEFGP